MDRMKDEFLVHHSSNMPLGHLAHQGLRVTAAAIFLVFFAGFAIDRSKKYIKVTKKYIKVDAVHP